MKSNGASLVLSGPESRAPQYRRLYIALACSVCLHALLMLFSGGASSQGRTARFVEQMLSAEGRSSSSFLIVSLPQHQISSGSAMDETRTPEPTAEETPAGISANISQDSRAAYRSEIFATPQAHRSISPPPGNTQSMDVAATRAAAEEAAIQARRATYTPAALLDVRPHPLQEILPDYPASAGNQEGTVVLQLFISEQGEVDELLVARATPRGFFEDAALAAFAPARFSPGIRSGLAVKSQLAVEVQFIPFNRGAEVSGRGY